MTSEPIFVRALKAEDWQDFSTIRLQALQDSTGFFGSNYEREKAFSVSDWQEWLSSPNACMFGLFDGTKIIGIIGLISSRQDVSGQTGIIISVYTAPEYRGRGFSTMLYKACIDWSIGHLGWNKLIVSHRKSNLASERATKKWNFTYTHNEDKTWPDGGREDDVFYEMDLVAQRQKIPSQQKAE